VFYSYQVNSTLAQNTLPHRAGGWGVAPMALQLKHDLEKACPALDAGWKPVFREDHAQIKR
jgi:hypothetical protein